MPANDYGFGYGLAALISTLVMPMLLLIVNVILSIVCMNLAKARGFNKVAAFFAGLLGGLVSLSIILMFPKKDQQI